MLKILKRPRFTGLIIWFYLFFTFNVLNLTVHVLGMFFPLVCEEVEAVFYIAEFIILFFGIFFVKSSKIKPLSPIIWLIAWTIILDLIELYILNIDYKIDFLPRMVVGYYFVFVIKMVLESLIYIKFCDINKAYGYLHKGKVIVFTVVPLADILILLFYNTNTFNSILVCAFFVLRYLHIFFIIRNATFFISSDAFSGDDNSSEEDSSLKKVLGIILALATIFGCIYFICLDVNRFISIEKTNEKIRIFDDDYCITVDESYLISPSGEEIKLPWVVQAKTSYKEKCIRYIFSSSKRKYDLEKDDAFDWSHHVFAGVLFSNRSVTLYYSDFFEKYGVVRKDGSLVTKPIYEYVSFDDSGLNISVSYHDDEEYKKNIINSKGKFVFDDYIDNFYGFEFSSDGKLIFVYEDYQKYYVYDTSGNMWDGIYTVDSHEHDFYEDYLIAEKSVNNKMTTVVIHDGEIIFETDKYLPSKMKTVSVGNKTFICITENEKYNFIDLNGKDIFGGPYSEYVAGTSVLLVKCIDQEHPSKLAIIHMDGSIEYTEYTFREKHGRNEVLVSKTGENSTNSIYKLVDRNGTINDY